MHIYHPRTILYYTIPYYIHTILYYSIIFLKMSLTPSASSRDRACKRPRTESSKTERNFLPACTTKYAFLLSRRKIARIVCCVTKSSNPWKRTLSGGKHNRSHKSFHKERTPHARGPLSTFEWVSCTRNILSQKAHVAWIRVQIPVVSPYGAGRVAKKHVSYRIKLRS